MFPNIVSDSRFLPISPSRHTFPLSSVARNSFSTQNRKALAILIAVYIRDNLLSLNRADRRLGDSAPLRKLFLIHPHFFTFCLIWFSTANIPLFLVFVNCLALSC